MRPHIIIRYIGIVLLFNALFLFISLLISIVQKDSALMPLAYSTILTTLLGLFPIVYVPATGNIDNKEGLVIVTLGWVLSCLIGTLPYILWGGGFTFTNAWFESVSGYTTTGSTIIMDIEALPQSLLFWRASTHWIGGIGIITFMLAVLPHLGKAGMILSRMELSALSMNNFHFRTRQILKILLLVYAGLTFLETIALVLCDMSVFDALTHSFATIATGGFSTRNLSIAYYQSPAIEIVIMVFMLLSGIHFGLLFLFFTGKSFRILLSSIVKFYVLAMAAGILVVMYKIHGTFYTGWVDSLRYAAFQVLSVGTSTGFATTDTSAWPYLTQLILIFFTLQCACAGSTSGGIKTDRILLFFMTLKKRIVQLQHPAAVVAVKIDGKPVDSDMVESSLQYVLLYLIIVFTSSMLLAALGVDSMTAFSASAATMGNVGPGFGMVGSMSNFSQIPDIGKWILSADMLLGRLEIYGLILLMGLKFWK
ncbi:MAG TPA: potassium transporter TrkG [Deltaproteobacteria bacterium]|nr:potassium transporter TrkG [Deltaproteobacteria bacterium]